MRMTTHRRFLVAALAVVVLGTGLAFAATESHPAAVAAVSSPTPALSPAGSASPAPSVGVPATLRPTQKPSSAPTTAPGPTHHVCTPQENASWSVARRWDEALLNSIRRALPNPPVHARNLFHLSVAMWDAWAAYDPTARGYLFHEKLVDPDVAGARSEAISYAAYRILRARFGRAVGGEESLLEYDDLMASLCYPTKVTTRKGSSPAAVGNRIAATVLRYGVTDGSNEAGGYADPSYVPVNKPLVVADGGASMVDPNRWQPLQMSVAVSQNGISTTNVQGAVGTHWGFVTGFGILDPDGDGVAMDPGPQPRLGDPLTDSALKEQLVELIRDSSELDPAAGAMIDISPGARGANDLGTNDGAGRLVNPVTGKPYPPDVVNLADFMRSATQFWADGPNSETPPGHWNVIANDVSDELGHDLRIGGMGPAVDRLEWDVKLYLAINGALHNAAIAAWGLKGHYDSSRPISLIRYMGGLGQSSDPARHSYNPEGLPLVHGLIELITKSSSAPGERHEHLRRHIGEIAVRAWLADFGFPEEPSGAGWVLATQWMTYQQPTFITPSFAGYVSGHSTFSRAAAEVMAAFTGSPFFPGGSSEYTIPQGGLFIEVGPTTDVKLEWATYFDAADQAGQSRLFGGIHIQADDFTGRIIGSSCGRDAWHLAQEYFAGAIEASASGCHALPPAVFRPQLRPPPAGS